MGLRAARMGGVAVLALMLPAGAALAQGGQQGRAQHAPMNLASPVTAPGTIAADAGSLRDFLFGSHTADRRAAPPVARFRVDDGEAFILQRAGASALLKFEASPEVWALTAGAGPRGDTIFKNDVGEPVLRMTRLGGVTLFTDDRPEGTAVSMAGAAGALKLPNAIGPTALFQTLAGSSARASRAAQRLITFVILPDATPKTDWLFADAAVLAAEAFVRLASQGPEGRIIAGRFTRVELLSGPAVHAKATGGVLQITVAPGKGVAGRPSSQKLYLVLQQR
jgi:hypothetical protein